MSDGEQYYFRNRAEEEMAAARAAANVASADAHLALARMYQAKAAGAKNEVANHRWSTP